MADIARTPQSNPGQGPLSKAPPPAVSLLKGRSQRGSGVPPLRSIPEEGQPVAKSRAAGAPPSAVGCALALALALEAAGSQYTASLSPGARLLLLTSAGGCFVKPPSCGRLITCSPPPDDGSVMHPGRGAKRLLRRTGHVLAAHPGGFFRFIKDTV